MKTLNIHVPYLYHLGNRVLKEFQECQSANSSMLNTHDIVRAGTFFSALRSNMQMIREPGVLDLPESDPIEYALRDLEPEKDIENAVFKQLARLIRTLLVELVNSQSSRNSSGINQHDRRRYNEIIAEAEGFLNTAKQLQPLDLVESSPRAPRQGAGNNGLDPTA